MKVYFFLAVRRSDKRVKKVLLFLRLSKHALPYFWNRTGSPFWLCLALDVKNKSADAVFSP